MSTHIMQIMRVAPAPPGPPRHSEPRYTLHLARTAIRLFQINATDAEIEQAILDYDELHTGGRAVTRANRKRDAAKVYDRRIGAYIVQLWYAARRVKMRARFHTNFVAICKAAADHPQGAAGWLAEHR